MPFPLTEDQKARIRRLLGMPATGYYPLGATLGLRTVIIGAGQMEYYMSQGLNVAERSIITGQPYAQFIVSAPVTIGQQLTVTITPPGSNIAQPVTYTVTSADTLSVDPVGSVAQNFAALISGTVPTLVTDATMLQANPYPQFRGQSISQQIAVQSLIGTFLLTSATLPVTNNGAAFPYPQFQVSDGNGNPAAAVFAYGLLPICENLEIQLINTSANLSFSQAGSPTTGQIVFRADELVVRHNLMQTYLRQLGTMLGFYTPMYGSSFGIRV